MAAGNSVNDEIREQQQKLKGKPFKEKWAYFWEYYKIHTLVTICVTIALISLIHTVVSQKDSALDVALVNAFLKDGLEAQQVAEDFAAYAQVDTDEYEVVIDPDLYVDYEGQDQYSYLNMQKLTAMAAAQALDIILTNDAYIDHNISAGLFIDLHEFFTDEELAKYEDRLIYRVIPDEDTAEYDIVPSETGAPDTDAADLQTAAADADDPDAVPIGIDVRDSKYLYSDQIESYFCIVSTAQNVDNAKLFLEYLLEP